MNILYIPLIENDEHRQYAELLTKTLGKSWLELQHLPADMEQYAEDNDVDMLIISVENSRRLLQGCLDACRDIRIPYLVLLPQMICAVPRQLLLPVTMLEEEVYKAQIAAHLSRYFSASILLLRAKDYGSHATQNVNRMATHFEAMQCPYSRQDALKDSFHLYREVTDRQKELQSDMVIWTASREYGLDDIVFGPPERSLLQRSRVPVMLVNPREDLFSLCD